MGAIQIYEKATGQVTPLELFQGDVVGAVPVYKEGDLYHQVKEDLADKLMAILSTYQRGQIDLGQIQNAQLYVIEQSRIAHAESLATVERMSDRALSSTEKTIAHQQQTITTLSNALATKSNASSNVSVRVETTGSDRYIDYEWVAWGVLFASIMGMTLVLTANIFQGSRQYQPQSALPKIEVRSL